MEKNCHLWFDTFKPEVTVCFLTQEELFQF